MHYLCTNVIIRLILILYYKTYNISINYWAIFKKYYYNFNIMFIGVVYSFFSFFFCVDSDCYKKTFYYFFNVYFIL